MAGMTRSATVTLPTDREILITREFNAPKHLVYKAWTTPDLVQRWWSGKEGNVTTVEIDLRVGGTWRYVIDGGGAHEVAFHGEYREIIPNERIVTTEIYEMPDAGSEADAPLNFVTFTEAGGRTTLNLLVQTVSKEMRDMIINSGMEVGMQKQMDALEDVARSLA